jgi:hypothetical protein
MLKCTSCLFCVNTVPSVEIKVFTFVVFAKTFTKIIVFLIFSYIFIFSLFKTVLKLFVKHFISLFMNSAKNC